MAVIVARCLSRPCAVLDLEAPSSSRTHARYGFRCSRVDVGRVSTGGGQNIRFTATTFREAAENSTANDSKANLDGTEFTRATPGGSLTHMCFLIDSPAMWVGDTRSKSFSILGWVFAGLSRPASCLTERAGPHRAQRVELRS